MKSERFDLGFRTLMHINEEAGRKTYTGLKEISPDFADMLIEFPFGDIYSRQQLDIRSREIATISALTVLGYATPQLSSHIHAGLNVGLSKEEILEIIIQMSVYAGFPAAINALSAAKGVFDERARVSEPEGNAR